MSEAVGLSYPGAGDGMAADGLPGFPLPGLPPPVPKMRHGFIKSSCSRFGRPP